MSTAKSSESRQPKLTKEATVTSSAALQAELVALSAQRAKDLERLREITLERDRLRFELAERNAEEAPSTQRPESLEEDDELALRIDGWQLKAAAVRAEIREEQRSSSLLGRFFAGLALRFARRAAQQRNYASAEVFYQVILLLTPRAFIWRQTGNMLAGQGLFVAAVDCFDRAIEANENDAEAWHARGVALRRSGKREEGATSIKHALQLDPALTSRDCD